VWIALSIVALAVLALRLRRRKAFAVRSDLVVVGVAVAGLALAVVHPDISLPAELWLAMPYVIALLALAGLVARVRMPQRLGLPYTRGERA
jgi:ABC-type uncharacterized transport system permease subunit